MCLRAIFYSLPDVVRLHGLATPWAGCGGGGDWKRKKSRQRETEVQELSLPFFLFVFLLKAPPQAVDGGAASVCSVKLGSDPHGCKKSPLYISSSRYSTSSPTSVTSPWWEQAPRAVRLWLGRPSGNIRNILSILVC